MARQSMGLQSEEKVVKSKYERVQFVGAHLVHVLRLVTGTGGGYCTSTVVLIRYTVRL